MADRTTSLDNTAGYDGYSAEVEIYLSTDGVKLPIGRVGPNYAVLRESVDLPIGAEATIVIIVDGTEHRYDVVLFHGLSRESRYVEFF